jgi:hypothetical protein
LDVTEVKEDIEKMKKKLENKIHYKLLEPLQGVKCIVGHWSYHLAAAIAMVFIDTTYNNWCKGVCTMGNKTKHLNSITAHSKQPSTTILGDIVANFGTQLNAHHEKLHKTDLITRRHGSYIAFRNIWMGHISVVCSVFFMTLMKRWNYYTVA